MKELNEYLDAVAESSKFPCDLGEQGGFVNFRNSGQRGSVKGFTLSLESILIGLNDIKSNLSVFQNLGHYIEKDWRDNGSEYFTDLVLKSMITVQTKPCFTTFSKIISWATETEISDYDDNVIDLRLTSLETAIRKLEILSQDYSPKKSISKQPKASINLNTLKLDTVDLPKPFLLLAGISGTGKTRFVREQAKASGQFDETYCLTSVRPDWHEPSDLLGYVSRLSSSGQAEYVTTDVLQFIAKAWRGIFDSGLSIEEQQIENLGERLVVSGDRAALDAVLPYWLCLDEMNLAPVEQYFADYLSVLETREWHWQNDDFTYGCDALLKPATIKEVANTNTLRKNLGFEQPEYDELWQLICKHGLSIPFNLIVAGTVNMDETTHGFSRKVIDRALSFDFGNFFPNNYDEFFTSPNINKSLSYPTGSQATQDDLVSTIDSEGSKTVAFLTSINAVLKNTPFELAYRALNELLLSVISSQPKDGVTLQAVWDDFMMCKVLPRIEGDSDKLFVAGVSNAEDATLLQHLETVLQQELSLIWNETEGSSNARPDLYRERKVADAQIDKEPGPDADKIIRINCRTKDKLNWMTQRLEVSTFTSFWP